MLSGARFTAHLVLSQSIVVTTALLWVQAGFAQSGLTEGTLSGSVADKSSAAIPGARITATSLNSAVIRTLNSGPDGRFSLTDLPSGAYRVEIEEPGFAPFHATVVLAVGRVTHLDAQLVPANANSQIMVTDQTSALDTSESSPVTNIDRDRIEELPIPSRNYLNFTLLSPTLTPANPAFLQLTPGAAEGGFSAGGLRPSSNAVLIDGLEDDDEFTGQPRTELSPEAISDFQIVNHGYAAQSGGAAGGSVDVETRSGATMQHGDAFLFVQNGALNGTPPLEAVTHKPDEYRLRAGFSTGGPFAPAHVFYYIAAEQEFARGEEASDFTAPLAGAIDDALLATGPLRGFQLHEGFFPTTDQQTELSARADRDFGRSHFMARYALTNTRTVNNAFHTTELADLSTRGSSFVRDNSLIAAFSTAVSPHTMNQVDAEVAQRHVVLRTGSTSGPGVEIAGLAEFGTPFSGNGRRDEIHFEGADHVMLQRGHHLFQMGGSFTHIAEHSTERDGFNELFVFPDLPSFQAAQPDFSLQSFGNPLTDFAELRTAVYAQDHWAAMRKLSIDYGMRYDDSLLPAPIPQHALNLAPRLGFAWSPARNWVARGGFGIFYDRYLLSTANRILEFDGVHGFQQMAEGAAAAARYRAAEVTSPAPGIAPSVWQAQPQLHNPYAETASLGVEHALPARWTVNAEARFVHGVHLGRTVNVNLPPPVVLTIANAAALGVPAPAPQQLGRMVFAPQRLNPGFDAIRQFQTSAGSRSAAATLSINRQFTEDFELLAGYTLSHTVDDASYDTESPQNPYVPAQDRARSIQDQRHRFVLSALWVLGPDPDDPLNAPGSVRRGPLKKFLYGFEFTPILAAGSGFPANPLTGVDSNREHVYPFAARPLGPSRNSMPTPPSVHFDLRVLRMIPLWRGHLDVVAESFNVPNHPNVELLNPTYGSQLTAAHAFARPIQNSDPRRVQFSLDFEY